MKREIHIFFTTLMFYTRIPCPKWVDHDPKFINLSVRYFPLIGWIVGGISFLFFWLGTFFIDNLFGVILAVSSSVLTTGAFHEDGFADVCDGFGGGWTKEKILLIMKDSRVGAYGVIGVFLLLSTKLVLLVKLAGIFDLVTVGLLFLVVHSLSRFMASTLIFSHDYVREGEDSKAKPVARQVGYSNLWIAALFVFIPLTGLIYWSNTVVYLILPVAVYFSVVLLGKYFRKWIGGYTGDCLGAAQQVAELVSMVSVLVIWKYI